MQTQAAAVAIVRDDTKPSNIVVLDHYQSLRLTARECAGQQRIHQVEIKLSNANPLKIKTGCLILPVGPKNKLSATAAEADAGSDKSLSKVLRLKDLAERNGATLMLHGIPSLGAQRVLLVRTGTANKITAQQFEKVTAAVATSLSTPGIKECLSCLNDVEVENKDQTWQARSFAQALLANTYKFDLHKSKKAPTSAKFDGKATLFVSNRTQNKAIEAGIIQGTAIANGISLARDLGNTAANVCTPTYLGKQAKALEKSYSSIKTKLLNEAQMKKLGMGALLSVSAGSAEPAQLICMEYKGAAASKKPVVLVGKGVTFDTGGISIKPSAGMDEMKFDMCGAASVFGVMQSVAEIGLGINVIGVVAAAENMPGSKATKPGDIVTSMSGKTIEVLNTDAEGRLVLCDALTYIDKYKPDVVIDIATLTGAVIMALGHHNTGLMSNDDNLADELLTAGKDSHDPCWRLPLGDDYTKQLSSNFADLANIGGRAAGTVTAGCFLESFCNDYRWAHLDIAGVAWKQGGAKGSTGRPVSMLVQFLLNRL